MKRKIIGPEVTELATFDEITKRLGNKAKRLKGDFAVVADESVDREIKKYAQWLHEAKYSQAVLGATKPTKSANGQP